MIVAVTFYFGTGRKTLPPPFSPGKMRFLKKRIAPVSTPKLGTSAADVSADPFANPASISTPINTSRASTGVSRRRSPAVPVVVF